MKSWDPAHSGQDRVLGLCRTEVRTVHKVHADRMGSFAIGHILILLEGRVQETIPRQKDAVLFLELEKQTITTTMEESGLITVHVHP